jgi:hypothetical protein
MDDLEKQLEKYRDASLEYLRKMAAMNSEFEKKGERPISEHLNQI